MNVNNVFLGEQKKRTRDTISRKSRDQDGGNRDGAAMAKETLCSKTVYFLCSSIVGCEQSYV